MAKFLVCLSLPGREPKVFVPGMFILSSNYFLSDLTFIFQYSVIHLYHILFVYMK